MIRTADVEDFVADLRKPKIAGRWKKPRTLSSASINRTIEIMRHMMTGLARDLDRTPFRRRTKMLIKNFRKDNQRRRMLWSARGARNRTSGTSRTERQPLHLETPG